MPLVVSQIIDLLAPPELPTTPLLKAPTEMEVLLVIGRKPMPTGESGVEVCQVIPSRSKSVLGPFEKPAILLPSGEIPVTVASIVALARFESV